MRLSAGCELLYEATEPAPLILMLQPRSGAAQQVISADWQLEPQVSMTDYIDSYGNLCQRLVAPEGQLRIKSTVTVDTADAIDVQPGAAFVPVQDLPDYVLQFLLPSRYCQADLLGELANQIVGDIEPAYDQADAVRHWIHSHIEYRYNTSDASTSAIDTEKTRVGVCRDFVHLGLALCRSLTIPARMVVGYLYQLDPMDLHAWFEAFVGDRWYTFDPTQPTPRGNRIAIAYGRDAADVALATQFGQINLTEMNVWVEPAQQ
ncbi:transglutaminase family protein [Nodosilinea sp. LEGE 06152]|uniref:transglutaminase domain-containing protein n=1 Tax=Nodosilinea sp. LEGE 06152 TaxID=2777966 RepID=UPI001881F3D4|nr:transglutaminase family protein [Nodosilinea sp. LEGE 06152]MBE9156046.1 transglutaminase family protein [Nodosilinea sp. LEGE 06152]